MYERILSEPRLLAAVQGAPAIYLSGHSLGGATVIMFNYLLRVRPSGITLQAQCKVTVFTAGTPPPLQQVGPARDPAAAAAVALFMSDVRHHRHYVHAADIVPDVTAPRPCNIPSHVVAAGVQNVYQLPYRRPYSFWENRLTSKLLWAHSMANYYQDLLVLTAPWP